MAERVLVVDHLKLNYEGIFNVTELYQIVDTYLRDKGFDKKEVRNMEIIRPEGKYIEIELEPWKKITDYAKHVLKIRIRMLHVKEIKVQRENYTVKLNKGRVNITFDGFLETDYEHRWEQKPFYFFLRTMFDKFVYPGYTRQWEGILKENVYQLHSTLKTFLNLYRY